jgi:hypothetical protein
MRASRKHWIRYTPSPLWAHGRTLTKNESALSQLMVRPFAHGLAKFGPVAHLLSCDADL